MRKEKTMGWHTIEVYVENEGLPREEIDRIWKCLDWLNRYYGDIIGGKNAEITELKKQLEGCKREVD